MRFSLRQLKYFIAAAETGSITLASKRASISQPAVSTAISHIERELEVQLFLRHHAQGLSLTPAGRALLRDAKQVLKQLAPLPMVLLDMPMSREYFRALFIRERLKPNIVWSSTKLDVVRTMVANGLGYTLANVRPRADVALDGRRLFRVPLSGDLPAVRIGIATLKELKKTRLVEAFERHCGQRISESYIPGMAGPLKPQRRKRR
jgi:DNA-binding transcriptional LysR family regulator